MTDRMIGEELDSIDWKQVFKLGAAVVLLKGASDWIKLKLQKYYKDE